MRNRKKAQLWWHLVHIPKLLTQAVNLSFQIHNCTLASTGGHILPTEHQLGYQNITRLKKIDMLQVSFWPI